MLTAGKVSDQQINNIHSNTTTTKYTTKYIWPQSLEVISIEQLKICGSGEQIEFNLIWCLLPSKMMTIKQKSNKIEVHGLPVTVSIHKLL